MPTTASIRPIRTIHTPARITRARGRKLGRSLRGALAALLLGPPLSGCILGTERPELALDMSDNYRYASKHNADAAVPMLDWWRGFRSGELTSLMEEAQTYNLDIAVAIAQIVQADAQVGIAGSPLLPSLTGNASGEAMQQAGISLPRFNVNLTASYMLDFWGRNRALLYAAEENATVSRYNREVVALTSIVTVANTYFQVLAAEDQLRVTRQNLAAAERILTLVRQQFNGGTASQLDLSQQEALVATQRANIPPLEVTRDQNIAALAVLVGRAPANFTVRGGSARQIAVPRVTPGLPSELLYQRPDIRLAEAQLAASNFNVEAARAAFFPQIQLTGTTGYQSTALASLFTPGAWYYTAIASLTQPIFDGFLLESQLKQAKGVQLQNLQTYRKTVLSAFANVETALIALQKFTLQEKLQSDAVASSRKAFDVAETQLRGGTINLITVLQAQQTLFTAESTLVLVRLNKLLAATSLFQALGGGWTPRGTLVSFQQPDGSVR
ncbi:efflux transporter outer membrane subunit [Bradyrhizobium sp. NP1]|uniref:efflux transporter outer membrane subunit n=1 Tax=Bradyrhizobium sp. NP1 TaxID=3049772 RepID=UPI0025A55621|nr:efflux transporter outer membrane subunit [Bradyrhizobium sp. NP1]WJR80444.1 efflux transporter outer membrane subunit [Bradyrhizobium sp. NP1]